MRPDRLDALAPAVRRLLPRLAAIARDADAYLAGSAALALYLGHRPAAGIDLMSAGGRLAGPQRRDLLAALVAADPATQVETARDGYLFVRHQGVPVRFFHYPYPLVDPPAETAGLEVASPADLGLMKLGAIISRASRRDFVDLYLLSAELPLATLLERAGEKFGHVRDFPLQALKGLADRALAQGDAMPPLVRPLAWAEVESWADEQVRVLGRSHAGLATTAEGGDGPEAGRR